MNGGVELDLYDLYNKYISIYSAVKALFLSFFMYYITVYIVLKGEVDALGVITMSRECFERCCSNKKTPPYHCNLSLFCFFPGAGRGTKRGVVIESRRRAQ